MATPVPRRIAAVLLPLCLAAAERPAHAEDVTIQTDTPGLQVWTRTPNVANVPVRVGRGTMLERADVFAPVCPSAPCATSLASGEHVLALSRGSDPLVESDAAVHIQGPTTLYADYQDRSALRTAGWGIFIASAAASLVLFALSYAKGGAEAPHGLDPAYGWAAAGVGGGGFVAALALVAQRDTARFSVIPLSLGPLGKRGEPSGEGSGLALRVRF